MLSNVVVDMPRALFNIHPALQLNDKSSTEPIIHIVVRACAYMSPAFQGCVPRAGVDDEGVHARGDDHRRQVAGGVCTELLQVREPDAPESREEAAAHRAAVQQVRGTERLAHLTRLQEGAHQGHLLDGRGPPSASRTPGASHAPSGRCTPRSPSRRSRSTERIQNAWRISRAFRKVHTKVTF